MQKNNKHFIRVVKSNIDILNQHTEKRKINWKEAKKLKPRES